MVKSKTSTKGSKTKKDDVKLADFELEAIREIKKFRNSCEYQTVMVLYKKPEFILTYDDITLEHFAHNEWRVYYEIARGMISENKSDLSENEINLYLEKHKKLKAKYIEYGGYELVEKGMKEVSTKNMDGYVDELNKWRLVFNLVKNKFPVNQYLSQFVEMTTEDIYSFYESQINHLFSMSNEVGNVKSYKVGNGIHDLIEKLNEGDLLGLPYEGFPILTKETNGISLGNLYLWLGSSGAGKSTMVRTSILPSIIKHKEKVVFLANEEDLAKMQKELLVWAMNHVFKVDYQKYKLQGGGFSPEIKEQLHKAGDWIISKQDQIILVELDNYTTDKAIKIIKKYASLGVNYFILDTFKHDSSQGASDNSWLALQMSAVKLFDTIKSANKNVALVMTMQLNKQSTKQRYLTQENISSAKNVVDVASGCYMLRWLLPDEYEGQKNEVKVYKIQGNSKVQVSLDENKKYQIVFLAKNRFGSANDFQIVIECDLSRNKYKEIGICNISPDW